MFKSHSSWGVEIKAAAGVSASLKTNGAGVVGLKVRRRAAFDSHPAREDLLQAYVDAALAAAAAAAAAARADVVGVGVGMVEGGGKRSGLTDTPLEDSSAGYFVARS